MSDLIPFLVVGVATGSVYGLAGMGLVLTFRTSGLFNFAHGGVAAAAAYAFYDLHVELGWPWPVALAVCVLGGGALAGLVLERLARSLAETRPVMTIVGTVGVLLTLAGFLTWHYGPKTLDFPQFLPTSGVRVAEVSIQWAQIILAAVGVGSAAGLYWFLRHTRLGKAMRAVVDDPALLSLAGLKPARVRRASWMIGAAFAALSGILIAPSLGRDAFLLTLLVVQAFGAAAVGAFSSVPLTYLGGLGTGVAGALATRYLAERGGVFLGVPAAIPFVVLVAVLLFAPTARLAVVSHRPAPPPVPPRRLPLAVGGPAAVAGLAALAVVPAVVGPKLPVFVNGVIFAVVFLSLAVLVWTSGQISLCHAVFVAFGASTFSHLTHGLGLPWLVALLLAGAATVPLGALVAVPALRLSGVYLALATFGFAVLVQRVLFNSGLMFGRLGFREAPRPQWGPFGGSDTAYYYVVLLVAVAAAGVVLAVRASRLGRLLRGMADSPVALVSHGCALNMTRLMAFSVSAFLAGVAGALLVANTGQVSADAFGPLSSLLWLAVLAISGTSLVVSPLLAAGVLAVVPNYLPDSFTNVQTMLFGLAAIAAALLAGRPLRLGTGRALERLGRASPVRSRGPGTAAASPQLAFSGGER